MGEDDPVKLDDNYAVLMEYGAVHIVSYSEDDGKINIARSGYGAGIWLEPVAALELAKWLEASRFIIEGAMQEEVDE